MKSKLLLLMCLVGALCFSCDDDNDFVELIAEKMSVSSARMGDQLVISGKGFSTIKEENIVKLNELIIPVEEATTSELKVIIPKGATTGNVTVRVDHQEVSLGELKIIELIAENLSVSSARVGDQLIITGKGFSAIKDENIVKLNDLTIPVEEATTSELKVIIPEGAKTGKITVVIGNEIVDFGELKIIELIAEKLSVSSAKEGDQLIITGKGFSAIKDENIVKLNELTIPVEEATDSELKVTIPKGAKTGNITVTVRDKTVDFGTFKVLEEQIFVLKTIYDNGGDFIVSIDPESGEETPFIELPKVDHDNSELMYASLCYLSDSKELLIMQRPEWPVDQFKIYKVNIETKELSEYDFGKIDKLEDISMISDGNSNVYIMKYLDWNSTDGNRVDIQKLDLESKNAETIASSTGELIYGFKVNTDQNRIYYQRENESEDNSTLEYLNLANKSLNKVNLSGTGALDRMLMDNKGTLYILRCPIENQYNLIKLNPDDNSEEMVMKFPEGEQWYGNSCYSNSTNEFIFFLEGDDDTTKTLIKANLIDKKTSVESYNGINTQLGYPTVVYL